MDIQKQIEKEIEEAKEYLAQSQNKNMVEKDPEEVKLSVVSKVALSKYLGEEYDTVHRKYGQRLHEYMRRNAFNADVELMNEIMKVPQQNITSIPSAERLRNFKNILMEEIKEVDEIIEDIEDFHKTTFNSDEEKLDRHSKILASIADWLSDIEVFCESEFYRHGLHPSDCKRTVMESNFTKLGDDGKPIYREDGKFLKGPNFVPPEKALQAMCRDWIKGELEAPCED